MKVFTHYYQFGVWDAEDKDSYPIPNKEDKYVASKKGLVILVNQEKEINVDISESKDQSTLYKVIESSIKVGRKGLDYGNVPAATVGHFNIPQGDYKLVLYADDKDLNKAKKFSFYLTPLGGR